MRFFISFYLHLKQFRPVLDIAPLQFSRTYNITITSTGTATLTISTASSNDGCSIIVQSLLYGSDATESLLCFVLIIVNHLPVPASFGQFNNQRLTVRIDHYYHRISSEQYIFRTLHSVPHDSVEICTVNLRFAIQQQYKSDADKD